MTKPLRHFSKSPKKIFRISLVLLASLIVTLSVQGTSAAKASSSPKKVIIFLIDNIRLEDVNQAYTPNLDQLSQSGGIGLMNTVTGGNQNPSDSYLTISSGIKAEGSLYSGQAFNYNEIINNFESKEIYKANTGNSPPNRGVVHIGIGDILKNNEGEEAYENFGALGDELEKAGLISAVIGNADQEKSYHREASLLAMNSSGFVLNGNVGSFLNKPDPNMPEGLATDYEAMYKVWKETYKQSDLIIVENGDLARLRFSFNLMTEMAYERGKKQSLEQADKFLGQLLKDLNPKENMYIVISPGAEKEDDKEGFYLTPVIISSANYFKKKNGLLISNSTRQAGIIKNTDIITTIFDFFGVSTEGNYMGSPSQVVAQKDSEVYLLNLCNQIKTTNILRQPILTSYITFIIIFIIFAVCLLYFNWVITPALKKIALQGLLFVLSVPLALLIQPLFVNGNPILVVIIASSMALIISILFFVVDRQSSWSLSALCGITSLAIIIDILAGSPLMKKSILGYSAVIGARLYGLGNEYMGILLGDSIIGLTSYFDIFSKKISSTTKWLLSPAFAALVFIIGYSKLGANVGGTIAAFIGFGLTLIWIMDIKLDWRKMGAITVLIIITILFLALLDNYFLAGQSSHLGRILDLVQKGEINQIYYLFQRKIAVNIKLFRFTIWSRVLLVAMVAFPFILMRPQGVINRLKKEFPNIMKGILGTTIAALTAFLVNDSGVVAAATTIIFAILGLLYIIFNETELYYHELEE